MDSRFLIVGQGSLQIQNVQASDAGSYTCRATNLEDSVDADAILTVHGKPNEILYNFALQKHSLCSNCFFAYYNGTVGITVIFHW